MSNQSAPNMKAPLLCWDLFCFNYNLLMEDAEKYKQSATAIKKIAAINQWSSGQTREALDSIQQYVIIVTDHLQQITFTGKGFFEMTGYSFDEAKGRNPNFLQGSATNKDSTRMVKHRLLNTEPAEAILENYRRNGDLYLCKIIIKPVININQKLVNYIAYEQEIAA